MDNQLAQGANLSVSEISALSNVKEIHGESKNYTHIAILFLMVVFAFFVVGLSVYNYQGDIKPEIQTIHAQDTHSVDLQKLTDQ